MILIDGIDHIRLVGIWDAPEGKAEDFSPENCAGYRSPKTPQERAACVEKAREYYNSCAPDRRTGMFGIITITSEQAEFLGEETAWSSLTAQDFEEDLIELLEPCRYCGQPFLPHSPSQKVCKRPECQRKRKAEKMAAYRKRKKSKPSQDPA